MGVGSVSWKRGHWLGPDIPLLLDSVYSLDQLPTDFYHWNKEKVLFQYVKGCSGMQRKKHEWHLKSWLIFSNSFPIVYLVWGEWARLRHSIRDADSDELWMYVHKGIMIFLGQSNSYYIICFFYCYKEDAFIELFIITPKFHLISWDPIRFFHIYSFTVIYSMFVYPFMLYLHFTLSDLSNHCSVFVEHYFKIHSQNILKLVMLHFTFKLYLPSHFWRKAHRVYINITFKLVFVKLLLYVGDFY